MQSATESDPVITDALARETGFPADAVASMIRSVNAGGGRMAQFDHPAFGGAGQWMPGGMLMIGDFSNTDLRRRVGQLCDAIAERLAVGPFSPATEGYRTQGQSEGHVDHARHAHPRRDWWPAPLGHPETSGAQDDMRYAWFARPARLAIDVGGRVTVYDTGDHCIGGVTQQQGGRPTLAFTSQHGPVDLAQLRVVEDMPPASTAIFADQGRPSAPAQDESTSRGDVFEALEKLAALHARGVLTADEFATKKAELLARI